MAMIHYGLLNRQLLDQHPAVKTLIQEVGTLVQLEAIQAIRLYDNNDKPPLKRRTPIRTENEGNDSPMKRKLQSPVGTVQDAADRWLDRLPATKRQQVLARAKNPATLTADQKRVLQAYQLNLNSPIPIADQLTPAAQAQLQAMAPAMDTLNTLRSRSNQSAQLDNIKNEKLIFRINRVLCVKDTREMFKDEIAVGGTAFDDEGNQVEIANRFVAEFKDGDEKRFNPPLPLASFDLLTLANDYPHTFTVMLGMAEIDRGGFQEFVQSLSGRVHELIYGIGMYGLMLSGSLVVGLAPIVGIVLIVAGAIVVGLLFVGLNEDELFPSQAALLELPDAAATFNGQLVSPVLSLEYKEHNGHYIVEYTWEIVKVEG